MGLMLQMIFGVFLNCFPIAGRTGSRVIVSRLRYDRPLRDRHDHPRRFRLARRRSFPPRPSRGDARRHPLGRLRPPDPRQYAGYAQGRLRARLEGPRRARAQGRLRPRAQERPHPHRHDARAPVQRPPRGGPPDREHFLLAGHGQAPPRSHLSPGLPGHPGRHHRIRPPRHPRVARRRPPLRGHRPAGRSFRSALMKDRSAARSAAPLSPAAGVAALIRRFSAAARKYRIEWWILMAGRRRHGHRLHDLLPRPVHALQPRTTRTPAPSSGDRARPTSSAPTSSAAMSGREWSSGRGRSSASLSPRRCSPPSSASPSASSPASRETGRQGPLPRHGLGLLLSGPHPRYSLFRHARARSREHNPRGLGRIRPDLLPPRARPDPRDQGRALRRSGERHRRAQVDDTRQIHIPERHRDRRRSVLPQHSRRDHDRGGPVLHRARPTRGHSRLGHGSLDGQEVPAVGRVVDDHLSRPHDHAPRARLHDARRGARGDPQPEAAGVLTMPETATAPSSRSTACRSPIPSPSAPSARSTGFPSTSARAKCSASSENPAAASPRWACPY